MSNRSVFRRAGVIGVLFSCALGASCTLRTARLDIPQFFNQHQKVYPWRVGVVTDKEFTPYKFTYRYWGSTNFTGSLDGLPEAFAKTLGVAFVDVETLETGRNTSNAPHDLIARMSVDELRFDGSNTNYWYDQVDLTMRFTLERPDGTEVFQTTIAARGFGKYHQECKLGFCRPAPVAAFSEGFENVFRQLSKLLNQSDIRFEGDAVWTKKVEATCACCPRSPRDASSREARSPDSALRGCGEGSSVMPRHRTALLARRAK